MKQPTAVPQRMGRLALVIAVIAFLALIPAGWALSQWPPINWRLQVLQADVRDTLFPHPDTLPTPVMAAPTPPILPTRRPDPTVAPAQVTEALAPTANSLVTPAFSPTAALPVQVALTGFTHQYQTFNNCGPATLTMALSYYGRPEQQAEAAVVLKPDGKDKNVSPSEMAAYIRQIGFGATVRVGGSLDELKRLIANGFPVIVEKGFEPDPDKGWMGHYLLLTGFDDAQGVFITQDSYLGPNRLASYAEVDKYWRQFNRLYIVPAPPDEAARLEALIGPEALPAMYEQALAAAQVEAAADPADAFAWFNVGTNLTLLSRYADAVAAFDQARRVGLPWRMLWYQFGPYEAYYQVGRYEDVITLAQSTLDVTDNLEESHYWLGLAQLAQGNADDAQREFESALVYNPNFVPAREALSKIP